MGCEASVGRHVWSDEPIGPPATVRSCAPPRHERGRGSTGGIPRAARRHRAREPHAFTALHSTPPPRPPHGNGVTSTVAASWAICGLGTVPRRLGLSPPSVRACQGVVEASGEVGVTNTTCQQPSPNSWYEPALSQVSVPRESPRVPPGALPTAGREQSTLEAPEKGSPRVPPGAVPTAGREQSTLKAPEKGSPRVPPGAVPIAGREQRTVPTKLRCTERGLSLPPPCMR